MENGGPDGLDYSSPPDGIGIIENNQILSARSDNNAITEHNNDTRAPQLNAPTVIVIINQSEVVTASENGGIAQAGKCSSRKGMKIGPRKQIPEDQRLEISRLINEEKRSVSSVATQFAVAYKTAYRIAAGSRGEAKFIPIRDMKTPKIAEPMPDAPPLFANAVDETPKLRGKKLTDDEKNYLGALVNIKRMSAAKVSAKYDVPKSSVIGYASAALNGKSAGKKGALPIIDAESEKALKTLASLDADQRPSRDDMEKHIAQEALKTLERRASRKRSIFKASAPAGGDAADDGLELLDEALEQGQTGKRICQQTLSKYLASYGF